MTSFADVAAGKEKRSSVPVDRDVLDAFDPLAESQEEQAARDAWASSEGHPPPPAQPDPESSAGSSNTQSPAAPPNPQPAPFPALTAFARSLALPIARRPARSERPMSMDHATLIRTPVMGDSFAEQQEGLGDQMQRRGSPKEAKEEFRIRKKGKSCSVDVWPTSTGSSSASPVGEGAVFDEKEAPAEQGRSAPSPAPPPPFDFQKFLDQMKSKGSEPVARYLRSFLSNFSKRTFTVTDQVKLINDFLGFISQKMRAAEPWRNATEAEFDNAMEGMEKLVMNRLYDYIFTPAISRLIPPRAITTDDLERDRVLAQRIALFEWIEPRHLDVPVEDEHAVGGFMMFAEQELVKVNHYKAPRDKLICILNCCKVIFGPPLNSLKQHLAKDESADTFLPILIFVVLKANPEHLLSNVEFINRFRNPMKLQSEAGYYLSSLMGAVSFIETMDHTSLSQITQEEFEKNVERAIQSLPSSRPQTPSHTSTSTSATTSVSPSPSPTPQPPGHAPSSSTSSNIHRPPAQPIPVPPPQPISSMTSPHAGEEPAQPLSLSDFDARRLLQRTGDTISKPLNAIGRIFSEALDGAEERFIAAHRTRMEAEEIGAEARTARVHRDKGDKSAGGSASNLTMTPLALAGIGGEGDGV
ncbi:hypothetical protein EWM64_g5310 [Hericium alpestre]|uniref:VPS9 domain-containing protein n=1 Tax=Hericium alpestre TaxID=135208 RepID=A0A4Y9ZZ54_9AGAM|nr:hypothetical protein EWM64_g5310 [Hericium alpestre]